VAAPPTSPGEAAAAAGVASAASGERGGQREASSLLSVEVVGLGEPGAGDEAEDERRRERRGRGE
jgi:hypothetical protein